jgi:hypothetical protein
MKTSRDNKKRIKIFLIYLFLFFPNHNNQKKSQEQSFFQEKRGQATFSDTLWAQALPLRR